MSEPNYKVSQNTPEISVWKHQLTGQEWDRKAHTVSWLRIPAEQNKETKIFQLETNPNNTEKFLIFNTLNQETASIQILQLRNLQWKMQKVNWNETPNVQEAPRNQIDTE